MNGKVVFLTRLAVCLVVSSSAYGATYHDLPTSFREKWEALLHFSHGRSVLSQDSDFFLSSAGATDPAAELIATIKLLENSTQGKCDYPARNYFLTRQLPSPSCKGFKEYRDFVSAEKVILAFATESDNSPVSSMGHVFLVLEGKNKLGLTKRHAVSFVADTGASPNLLIDFMQDEIAGRYILNSYDDLIYNYISNEKRSLWEYELTLSAEEKTMLFLHVYELKEHGTKYSFFSHNCATGLNRVLTTANPKLAYRNDRFYVTPIEYIKFISQTGRVRSITVRPSVEDKYRLSHNYSIDPLNTVATSRLKVGGLYDNRLKGGIKLEFLPFSHSIEEHLLSKPQLNESKFFEIISTFYNDRALIERVTVISLRSLPNLAISSLKPNFGFELHGDVNSDHTSLYPDLHLGTGGVYGEVGIRPYFSLDVGVHWNPGKPQLYGLGQLGIYFTDTKLGKASFSLKRSIATEGDYRGMKLACEITYSLRMTSDISFGGSMQFYRGGIADNDKRFLFDVGYRF